MNSFYIYRADIPAHQNILVCFIASHGFDLVKFKAAIKNAFDGSPFSRELVLISADFNRKEILESLIDQPSEIKKLKQSINNYQTLNLHLALIHSNGTPSFQEKIEDEGNLQFSLAKNFDKLVDHGLIDILSKNNLVMESSPNYHFVKPSGKHSRKFMKASNVMQRSAEISFLAVNLLKHVNLKIDKIYTDTAGIFPLAYELISIKRRFSDDLCEFIDSFGTYKGLESYTFAGTENTLVLISASTSDDLFNKLKIKSGLEQAKIVSLFGSNPNSISTTFVNLTEFYSKYKLDLFANFTSSSEHECEMCIYEKSIPLSLSNSQFVFEAPKSELYLPIAKDSTAALRGIISNYKDSRAFKCLYDGLDGKSNFAPEYFIDVSKLVSDNLNYQKKINNYVTRSFPLSADLIVHANDQGAYDLATSIKKEVKRLGKNISISSIDEIEACSPKLGIVVVAGSIQTGKSLLDISRKLRTFDQLPISYVVGFAKFNDWAGYTKLKNDLCYNNGNPSLGSHQFNAIEEIMLPINEHRTTSWDREHEVIKLAQQNIKLSNDARNLLNQRSLDLRQATDSENQGIGTNIFLQSPTKNDMKLGKTFAFWNDKDNSQVWEHQATVYFTISSILQGLRYSKNPKDPAPLKSGYILKQLDPLLFDRFNEGIIQASVLRSAKPRELDYSADDASSKIIGTLIERMVEKPDASTSEALPEFLLAICSSKLQIKKDHIKNLSVLNINSEKYPLTAALYDQAKALLFGNVKGNKIPNEDIPF
ncbi:hypothetical protein CRX42_15020 [Pseudomonas jessenii]|uniref:Uncharacterized protein n=1 Tax=Pseudomonas jessenii TaxID=77298 RepID=A0A2W0EX93_PSEJE|nr:hypothetical protein [Pseudomonas jessenii]PYY69741.1 hypothetical protein CRX42_15020 [Pseudomonas jessenii]